VESVLIGKNKIPDLFSIDDVGPVQLAVVDLFVRGECHEAKPS
jgi:hypothetical protein